jgi:hypothetical protein
LNDIPDFETPVLAVVGAACTAYSENVAESIILISPLVPPEHMNFPEDVDDHVCFDEIEYHNVYYNYRSALLLLHLSPRRV